MSGKNRNNPDWWLELEDDLMTEIPLHKPRQKPDRPRPRLSAARAALAEELYQPEAEYNFTYKASRHERLWLSQSLNEFYDDHLISDVLHIVKGGKEANVYCCQAHPNLGMDLLAAKVYRPRLLRNLKNDALYKEGRAMLADDGKELRDHRGLRAIQKKTRIGSEMVITSWIEHEYQALQRLHQAGVHVPRPVIQAGNAILMEYIGERGLPAPALSEVRLPDEEVRPLFDLLMGDIELMLANNTIHADLSAYNILYWEGTVTIIDLPQVVDPLNNPSGAQLLARDVERVCQYFQRYLPGISPRQIANDLWSRFQRGDMIIRRAR